MKRRILAILLASLMVLSAVPVVAFAEETVDVSHRHHCAGADAVHQLHAAEGESCEYCEFVETVEPTCVNIGYDKYVCTLCETPIRVNFVDATGEHDYQVVTEGKAATCTEDGYTAATKCATCDAAVASKVIPATGHNTQPLFGSDATCTVAGQTQGSWCTTCKTVFTAQETIPAKGHVFGTEPVSIVAPDCANEGSATFKCEYCTETKTVPMTALNPEKLHTLVKVEANPATCTAEGNIEYWNCTVCNKKFANNDATGAYTDAEVVIAKVEHTWDEGVIKAGDEAACEKEGVKTYTCQICGAIRTEAVEALEHQPEDVAAVDPTCTETGLTKGSKCSVCGETLVEQEEVAVLGHDMAEDTEARVDPTCTEAGSKTEKCSRCDETVTTTLDATGHTGKFVQNKSQPTCTETGADYMFCTVCETLYEQPIEANGHTEETVAGKDATCTEDGLTAGKKCSVCGTTLEEQEVIPATGHTYESTGVVITPATCTATGVGETKCACGATSTEELAIVAHTPVVVPGYAATCTENGLSDGSKCSVCNAPLQEQTVIVCTGHTGLKTETQSAATCTDNGSKLEYCSDCNHYVHYVYVDAEGAPVSSDITKDMTAEEIAAAGYKAVDPAKGHTYAVDGNGNRVYTYTTEPTCMVAGVRLYECTACEYTYTETEPAFVYNPNKTYETLEDAKEIHVAIDESTKRVYRTGTCTIIGLYDYECKDCGNKILVVMQNTGSGEHNYTETAAAIAATCTTAGKTAVQTCTNINSDGTPCNHTIGGVEIPALGHNVCADTFTARVDATCTEDGMEGYYTCDREGCGQLIKADGVTNIASTDEIVIEKLGHDTEIVGQIDPTCYSKGAKGAEQCKVCKEIITADEEIDMIDHTLTDAEAKAPTCTEIGWDAYQYCTVDGCGYTTKVEKAAIGHKDGVIADGMAATCEKYGYVALHGCVNNCGDVEQEWVEGYQPALGHSYAKIDAESYDATCTTDGLEVQGCQNAGCTAPKMETVLPATGHATASGATLTGTCQDKIEDRFCVNCETEISLGDHKLVVKVELPATCLKDGYKVEVCEYCGGEEKTTWYKAPATGHEMGDFVVTTPADMATPGVKTSTCANCDHFVTEEYYAADVIYTVDVDNYDKSGVGYTDGSIVSVIVNATGMGEIGSMYFELTYGNALEFIDYTVLTDMYGENVWVNDLGDKIVVAATASGATDVALDGTAQLIMVRFKINDKDATSANFAVTGVKVMDSENVDYLDTLAGTASIKIRALMDFDGENGVDIKDAEMAYQMYTGVAATGYDVTLDVDKNGVVEMTDFVNIYRYIVGLMTYEDVMALRN